MVRNYVGRNNFSGRRQVKSETWSLKVLKSLTRALFEHRNDSRPIAITFLANLLKLGCARGHAESLLPRFIEKPEVYHPIICTFFIASEKTKKNFEKLAAIIRSIENNGQTAYLKLRVYKAFISTLYEEKLILCIILTLSRFGCRFLGTSLDSFDRKFWKRAYGLFSSKASNILTSIH